MCRGGAVVGAVRTYTLAGRKATWAQLGTGAAVGCAIGVNMLSECPLEAGGWSPDQFHLLSELSLTPATRVPDLLSGDREGEVCPKCARQERIPDHSRALQRTMTESTPDCTARI